MCEIRVNKYLSEAGVCSRRAADLLIRDGRVTINGLKASAGDKAGKDDKVELDGKEIKLQMKKILLAFNKPVGVVCTAYDPKSKDINIIDYIDYGERIFTVGRLDKGSEGLILLTNDGELADKISKSRNNHEKEYEVEVNKDIKGDFLRNMAEGVPVFDTITKKCRVRKTGKRSFNIVLTQGLNRQIRRMCEFFDYRVVSLKRIRIMNIKLGSLEKGKYRVVSGNEYDELIKGLG